MSTLKLTFYTENNQILTITGLADQDGTVITTATVSATLFDPTGAPVQNFEDIEFSAVSGTPGTYQLMVPPTLAPVPPAMLGAGYKLQISGTNNGVSFQINSAASLVTRVM